jgi:hypothetical protein
MLTVPVATPSEMAECKLEALSFICQSLQNKFASGNHFFTNAVSWDARNFVSFHGRVFNLFMLICKTQTLSAQDGHFLP